MTNQVVPEAAVRLAVADRPSGAMITGAENSIVPGTGEAERLLADFIADAPAVVAMFDRDMHYLGASANWKAAYHLDSELTGRSHYEVFPDISEEWKAIHRRALAGEVLRSDKDKFERLDGSVQWLKWEVRPWYRARGETGGIVIFSEDITEQVSAQDTLSIKEERFRLVVEASPSGMIMTDPGGKIVLVNAEAERLSCYPRDELIGKAIETLVPTRIRGGHVQLRDGFNNHPEARAMGAGRDLHIVRKDGTELPVEIGLNPIRTAEGTMVLSAIIDISERKRSEAALQQFAERDQLFVAAVESSDDAIVTKSLDGVITAWNPAAERLFGYSAREAIGNSIDIIVPAEFRSEVRMFLGKVRNGEKIDHHETVRVAKDGHRIDVSLSISPLKSSDGKIIGAAKIARDITAEKRNQRALAERSRELVRSNAELEQFAYVASHDLQEPLRMIATYTGLLAESLEGSLDEKTEKYIHYVLDGAKRMQYLIKDLLAYARVDSQGVELRLISSENVVRSVLDGLKVAIEENNAEIVHDALPKVRADAAQLGQVFQNLIGNALKFHGERTPRIHIGAERRDGEWEFRIADNGIGIEKQYAAIVFQLFQRLHARGRYHGSGIGLAIAKKIVERHGGRIWFESELDKGTTFYFTIPAAQGNNA
jgi:PAS domain S-box-containing protein